MDESPNIPRIASLLAAPARARIVWTLIDGTMRPAGELAYAANISAQSASAHLAKLVESGLLDAEPQGRHRYFRIASAEVAGLIEGIASLSAATRLHRPRSGGAERPVSSGFLHARTCYGHLAGEMAVRILDGMLRQNWLTAHGRDYSVSRAGELALAGLGVDLDAARRRRRVFARTCVEPHTAASSPGRRAW